MAQPDSARFATKARFVPTEESPMPTQDDYYRLEQDHYKELLEHDRALQETDMRQEARLNGIESDITTMKNRLSLAIDALDSIRAIANDVDDRIETLELEVGALKLLPVYEPTVWDKAGGRKFVLSVVFGLPAFITALAGGLTGVLPAQWIAALLAVGAALPLLFIQREGKTDEARAKAGGQ